MFYYTSLTSQTILNLQQLYLICSNFILVAATLFYLQQLFNLQYVPCGPPYGATGKDGLQYRLEVLEDNWLVFIQI